MTKKTPSQSEIQAETIRKACRLDIEKSLNSRRIPKGLSFAELERDLVKCQTLLRSVDVSRLDDFLGNQALSIVKFAEAINCAIERIDDFEPTSGQAHVNRKQIILSIKADIEKTYLAALLPISLSRSITSKTENSQPYDFVADSIQSGASEKLTKLNQYLNEARKHAQETHELNLHAREKTKSLNQMAMDTGLDVHVEHLEKEAKYHQNQVNKWRNNTISCITLLLLFTVASMFLHKFDVLKPHDDYDMIQLAVSKVLIFGTLSYAVFLSTRNFMAHKHNVVINKHKSNALTTFKAFVDSADQPELKDIILDRASQCIFSINDSGFTRQHTHVAADASSLMIGLARANSNQGTI